MRIENICMYVLLLLLIICFTSKTTESYSNYHLGQPTKCFDCESQLPEKKKYLGGPTKCFDCENQIAMTKGTEYADLAQPTKCFDCEQF